MSSDAYIRSRRLAALAGGGLLAALALVAFVYQLPSTFFSHVEGPLWLHWIAFAVFYMAYATLSLPFDVWAGYWLPCRHQKLCRLLPVFLGTLFRAESAQFAVMTLSATAMLAAGVRWGVPGAVGALALAQAVLILLHPRLAAYLGSPPAGRLSWRDWLPGAAWVLAGVPLFLQLPWCGAATPFQLIETLLGCAFWSLLGYWLLRARNRPAAAALQYLSWASFGIFSRSTADSLGLPEHWAVSYPVGAQPARNPRAASQIAST